MEGKITRAEAVEKIKEWAMMLEATDPGAEGFDGAIEPLILPIMNGRLDFDIDMNRFTLKLIKPLVGEKTKTEVVQIHELDIKEKKIVQRYKDTDTVDKSEALLAQGCDIPLGDASKIGSRDQSVISAVLTVFFS